jgi:GTP:adenosylcobinamide-phosphate guanylyltransferase
MTSRRAVRGYTALLLAGRRGPDDPLAEAAGAPHRAFLDVAGVPMLERVLRTLCSTPCIGDIVISIDRPELLDAFPGIVKLRADRGGRIVVVRSADSPSRSVLAALDEGSREQPMLVTTADHALLSVEIIEHFLAEAEARGGDVTVALVAESLLQARFPESIRTYLPFAGERYSGANLFAFLTPRARLAVEFWTRAESFRKRPWRLVATFGVGALLQFLLRRLDLDAAFERVSSALDVRVEAVTLPQPEAAVDVDKLADLALVNRILEQEAVPGEAAPQAAVGHEALRSGDPKATAPDDPGEATRDEPEPMAAGAAAPTQETDQSLRSPSATKPPVASS